MSLDEPKIFPRAPLAFGIMFNMKKALIILSVVLLAAEATAFVSGRQRGYKNGDSAKSITKGGAREVKEKGAAACVLTALDDLAWLFNIRGADVKYLPVALCLSLKYLPAKDSSALSAT